MSEATSYNRSMRTARVVVLSIVRGARFGVNSMTHYG